MPHHLAITINGQPRDEIVLATTERLNRVIELSLEFQRHGAPDGFRLLRSTAEDSDYAGGAYHFHRWHWWPSAGAGTYRARAVRLRFADGNTVDAPLDDDIVVEAKPLAPTGVPSFTAR
jgi:hypothetical protein